MCYVLDGSMLLLALVEPSARCMVQAADLPVCCAVLFCAGEHVVVPLLCLSGVVPSPGAENGPNNGRVLVNLDLTNAQPAPGIDLWDFTLTTQTWCCSCQAC